MRKLLGRAAIVDVLGKLLDDGVAVLLYGPVGAGKTSVLRSLEARVQARRVPCAVSPTTETLGDLTHALARAYPSVDACSGTMRQIRARLRNAVEQTPGAVLLDHLGRTGTAFKGALKSMRGTGVGVLLAADVEHHRDHARFRSRHLVNREVELPPLHGSTMNVLLKALLAETTLPLPLRDADLRELAAATDGLPGRAVWFVSALQAPTAWRNGRPRCDWLRTEAIIAAAERYRTVERRTP
jgi:AAA+ superfamily predicted ATPase